MPLDIVSYFRMANSPQLISHKLRTCYPSSHLESGDCEEWRCSDRRLGHLLLSESLRRLHHGNDGQGLQGGAHGAPPGPAG